MTHPDSSLLLIAPNSAIRPFAATQKPHIKVIFHSYCPYSVLKILQEEWENQLTYVIQRLSSCNAKDQVVLDGNKAFSMFPVPFCSTTWCSWLLLISLWTCPKALKILLFRIYQKENTYESTQPIAFPFDNLDFQNNLAIPISPGFQHRACYVFWTPDIQYCFSFTFSWETFQAFTVASPCTCGQ